MTQLFSKQQLHALRNSIPINDVIQFLLALPAKESEGYLRFLCPLCSEFQTATNPKTNLARCFRCKKNFNTIDLVMQVEGLTFKPAVKMLFSYAAQLKKDRSQTGTARTSSATTSELISIQNTISRALNSPILK